MTTLRILLWDRAFLSLFVAKANSKFTKQTKLRKMEVGAKVINCALYRYFYSSTLSQCFSKLLPNFSSYIRYVHYKLVGKEAIRPFFVCAYLEPYMDNSSKVFLYTSKQFERFDSPYLMGAGWYFDCQVDYTSPGEDALVSSLTNLASFEPIVYEEEAP